MSLVLLIPFALVALAAPTNVTNSISGVTRALGALQIRSGDPNTSTAVSVIPTNAALHPGWPQTVLSIAACFYPVISPMSGPGSVSRFIFGGVLQIVQILAWAIAFAHIQGQLRMDPRNMLNHGYDDDYFKRSNRKSCTYVSGVFTMTLGWFFWAFASMNEFVVTVQRWDGTVGTTALIARDASIL